MKASRGYLAAVGLGFTALAAVSVVSLFGYFRAVEHTSAGQGSERRVGETLKLLQGSLADAEKVEDAKARMKSYEAVAANGPDSGAIEKIRRAFAPTLSIFASKPREAEPRYQMAKKRELMEALVNSYRKEIPNGDIRLRAAYLNILFDTQSSLMDEDDKTAQVFVRRNKERLSALRGLAAAGDAALQARVANIESIFTAYESGLEQAIKWKEQKAEALAGLDKVIPKLAKEMHGTKDVDSDAARRDFLYTAVGAACVFLASLLALFIAHNVFRIRSETRTAAFIRFLKEFGSERADPQTAKEIAMLKADRDWSPVINGGLEAEASFIAKYQSLIAVPKSMVIPFVVFSRDKVAQHWNDEAAALLSMKAGEAFSLDDVLSSDTLSAREGDSQGLREMVRNSFATLKEDTFEGQLKRGEAQIPVEILSSPITSGPLAGGKVYLFREIRNEAERIDRSVAGHLQVLRDYAQKISVGAEALPDGFVAANVHPEVKRVAEELYVIRQRADERESLWKSETGALMDQVVREREILERLSQEIRQMREAQVNAMGIVGAIHGFDENWHDEVCSLERDMERWKDARRRLEVELNSQQSVVKKARVYEEEVRKSAEAMREFVDGYESVLAQLNSFCEEAKIHSVNLSFSGDPSLYEYASRARAYAQELSRFVDSAADLSGRVKEFVARHPGTSLTPHLTADELDATLFSALKTEEERLASFLGRWRETGEQSVNEGEKAIEILRQADKQAAVATQLGDTMALINAQAQGNLERWN